MEKDVRARLRSWIVGGVVLSLSIGVAGAPDLRLIEAVQQHDVAAIRKLLQERVDVNVRQPDGATALHWAIHRDDLETARLLVRAGARADAANDYGMTPLLLACTNGSAAAVDLLLEAGANPNLALPSGQTPLMTAAKTGNVGVVKTLIGRGAAVHAKEGTQNQTALMWAVSEKHAEVARVLIEAGADVRARANNGVTPLLLAARRGDIASATLLLDRGADVNETAADKMSPLVVAAIRDQVAFATFLLDRGADPNQGGAGFTALHWASGIWETELTGPHGITASRDEEWRGFGGITEGKLDFIRALLAHGADPNAEIVKPPLRVGFTRGGLNMVGATPFLIAAAAGDSTLMYMLTGHGANPTLTTKEKTTALMAAAGVGRVAIESTVTGHLALEAATVALELGADVNAVNYNGDTALHGAASMQSESLVRFLVGYGARIDVKNKRGQTPVADLLRTLEASAAAGAQK